MIIINADVRNELIHSGHGRGVVFKLKLQKKTISVTSCCFVQMLGQSWHSFFNW